jgi:hypothetical protein
MTNWRSRVHLTLSKANKSNSVLTLILLGTLGSSCIAFETTFQQRSRSTNSSPNDVAPNSRLSHKISGELIPQSHDFFTRPIHLATSAATTNHNESAISHSLLTKAAGARNYNTNVDLYFQEHHTVPMPTRAHVSLDNVLEADNQLETRNGQMDDQTSERILIVGDVHGCLNELKALVAKASTWNNSDKAFKAVILVGDLCNKGPHSSDVIRFVRQQKNWFSVRGNHDNAALTAALGDKKRSSKKSYGWIKNLSDEDVTWMSQLPYTITIPKYMLNKDGSNASSSLSSHTYSDNVIVVHAGFVPGVALEEQEVQTMTTIREVVEVEVEVNSIESPEHHYTYFDKHQSEGKPLAWAQVWNGPELVIFGHDAKRGLQNEKYAIGLDSGACYGKRLTGIILPDRRLVSVESEKIHAPL